MSVNTATATELTAENVQRVLLQPLEAASTFLASGPRIVDSSSPVRFPKLGGLVIPEGETNAGQPTTPDWIGEGEEISLKDVDFDELSLMPSTMKSLKTITKYSNEMSRQSVVALDAALQSRLVRDVAFKLDAQFWGSSGDGITTPRGMLAQAGTQSLAYEDGDALLDVLTDAWGLCLSANVDVNSLRFVMRPETYVALRKVKEGTTSVRPILQPDVTADAMYRVLGVPVTLTPNLPTTPGAGEDPATANVLLMDFSQVIVVRDLAASVTILRELFAGTDEQGIRVISRFDVGLQNPEAVVKVTGIPA